MMVVRVLVLTTVSLCVATAKRSVAFLVMMMHVRCLFLFGSIRDWFYTEIGSMFMSADAVPLLLSDS
jgi:hypothetical protein